jgi:hypothetical protein
MTRYHLQSILVPVLLLLALPASSKAAATYTLPKGLTVGEEFQLVFMTFNNYYSATDTNIADYNADVTADAKSSGSIVKAITLALNLQWKAIVSTEAESAAANIGTSTAPIYNLGNELVANGTAGLWSGSLKNEGIQFSEDGYLTDFWTYSGTNPNGSIAVGDAMGDANVITGETADTDSTWIDDGPDSDTIGPASLEAISPLLIVTGKNTVGLAPVAVPEPARVVLTGIALTLVGNLFIRRRRHPLRSRS